MPKLEYFLVAESVSIDRDRNQVSVFNILEEVCIPKTGPMVIPHLVALSSWILDPEDQGKDFQVGIEIFWLKPDNHEEKPEFQVNFTARGNRQRAQIGLVGMPLIPTGDILFHLKLNGVYQASHVLTVRMNDEQDH